LIKRFFWSNIGFLQALNQFSPPLLSNTESRQGIHMPSPENKIVLATGASSGIGEGTAHVVDAETTPVREPEHYRYDLNLAEIAELRRRGSVIASDFQDKLLSAMRFEFGGHLEKAAK
jgi:hypothetical protein